MRQGRSPLLEPTQGILAHSASKIYSNAGPGPEPVGTDAFQMQTCLGTGLFKTLCK